MLLYNTLSQKKERLLKPRGRALQMFVCGPTVYDDPHIGNARTYLAFDAFTRYLRSTGQKVYYLQNITNIDDKIIARARDEGVPAKEIAHRYERVYLRNMRDLGISSVDRYARGAHF